MNVEELGEVTAYIKTAVSRFAALKTEHIPDSLPALPASLSTFSFTPSTMSTCHSSLGSNHSRVLCLRCRKISVEQKEADDSVNVRTQFYHQLGTLLKSAIAAARVTPAHRYYVRKQSADSFVIMYQVQGLALTRRPGSGNG